MKIPIEWLGEYVDIKGLSDEEVSLALTMTGTENEIAKDLGTFENIVVGEIKEIEKHSNADKLQVTKTDVGKSNGGVLQIVCGATNIEVGQKVPVALIGAKIGDFEITKANLRGVESNGMLCSESELGISDDHSGIMILDARAKVGEALGKALNVGGAVLEAEITPNRSDCLSVIGNAREAAAALNRSLKKPNYQKSEVKSTKTLKVEVKEKELCPRYIAKMVEGVKIGPSPKWMQDRLSAVGIRPINNVVDVTNYVMMEWGQPLHAFDANKISGKIIIRKAKAGEELVTLDGEKRKLTANDIVIADEKKAIGLAGVMGGLNSEVTEKTTTVVLEAAVFDRTSIRKTAQRLGLRSEASNRFEKGIPLGLPEITIERAAELLEEISKEKKEKSEEIVKVGANTDVLSKWIWVQHVGMRLSAMEQFMGIKIPENKVIEILKSLGFEVEKFDIKKEARRHVGKPYVMGASFKTHGDMAFDCSYLTDYIYSRIGKFIGYTSLAQYKLGKPVKVNELQPGDVLFVNGVIEKSVTDHYYIPDGKGGYEKVELEKPERVGHNAIYIGDGRIVHAKHYDYDMKAKKWVKGSKAEVVEDNLEVFTKNPEFIGARRFIDNPNDWLAITVPWWRLDVAIEEDIFEEIGRIYGYNNFPSSLPKGEAPLFEENQSAKVGKEIKDILVGAGFNEVYNYSFVSEKALKITGTDPKKAIRVANPISPEQEYMRTNLACSLLSDALVNKDNFSSFKIFEVASVYIPGKNKLPEEIQTLGMLVKSEKKEKAAAFFELKGALELLAQKYRTLFEFKPTTIDYLEKGHTAEVLIRNKRVGYLGVVSEKTKHDFGIIFDVAVAEINLPELIAILSPEITYTPISKFPTAERDINLLFDKKLTVAEIKKAIEVKKPANLISFEIKDIYEGGNLSGNQKSVTIGMTFGSSEKTLGEAEISASQQEVIALLTKVGGKLRTE